MHQVIHSQILSPNESNNHPTTAYLPTHQGIRSSLGRDRWHLSRAAAANVADGLIGNLSGEEAVKTIGG